MIILYIMKEEALRKFGLTEKEIKVYLAALELDSALVSEIAKKAEIPRTLTYDILKKLMDKGLVSYVIKNNKKYFGATEPTNLLTILREKEQIMEAALPELLRLKRAKARSRPIIEVFEGKEGVKTVFNDALRVGKEFLCLGSTGRSPEIISYFLERFHKQRIKRRIPWRVIYNDDRLGKKRGGKTSKWAYSKVRYMKKTDPTTTYIYGNKVAIVLWMQERLLAVMIEDGIIAKAYREFFNALWESAHP